jgi:rhodanese-related sulfurtransferase
MKLFKSIISAALLVAFTVSLGSSAPTPTKKKKTTPQGKYLTAAETFDVIKKDSKKVLFIDVRTQYELEYVGYTKMIDRNIPIVFKTDAKWDAKKSRFARILNKNFVADVKKALKAKGLTKKDHIIFMCRSGSRSAYTAKLMAKAGYMNVSTVVDGFEGGKDKKTHHRTKNGWKNAGKSWTYKLDKTKMYIR